MFFFNDNLSVFVGFQRGEYGCMMLAGFIVPLFLNSFYDYTIHTHSRLAVHNYDG